MTEIGGGRGYGGGYGGDPGHDGSRHDILTSGEDVLFPGRPDPSVRRQAAEANARAAEARAASAAADAKAAIELAARAAAAADAAARAAAEAGAAARAAVQADADFGLAVRPALDDRPAMGGGAHSAPPWVTGPRHGAPEDPFDPGPRFADTALDPAPDTDVLHHVVPAPRPEPARHAAHPDAAHPGADLDGAEPGDADLDHADLDHAGLDDTDLDDGGPDDASSAAGGRAERRRAAAETTVFAQPLVVDEPVTELVDAAALAQDPAGDRTGDEPPLVAAGRRRRAAAGQAEDDRYENDDDAPATGASATGGRRAARRARKGLFRRRAPRLAAGAAVGALALSGVAWLNSGADSMEPAAMVEASAPAVPQLPVAAATDPEPGADTLSQGDPLSERGTEFLAALREAGVPTSRGGAAETEAAELVCGELADGVDEARIARALPASLPSVTRAEAADLVDIAQETYCTS